MRILVTGGAGFIGSHFIRMLMSQSEVERVINLDKLTYAGHLDNLREFKGNKRYQFVRGDIAAPETVDRCVRGMDAVVNFAAETHVDRSIQDAAPFLTSNVIGVQVLLESCRRAGIARYLQVSTDEVYGSIKRGAASESDSLDPSSPYSASKASADHLTMAAFRTFGQPVIITRAANNYGPFQYPEKFLPLFITHALENKTLPLYGDGLNVREWLHVTDHCEAIWRVLERGRPGQIYNIGTEKGHSNLDVVRRILKRLHKPQNLVKFVKDRPGHDRRYAMSTAKIRRELGWKPRIHFDEGLEELIRWYEEHRSWWEPILRQSKIYKKYYSRQYARRGS
jgi:dTDP-glucose 4,6-dehydratase